MLENGLTLVSISHRWRKAHTHPETQHHILSLPAFRTLRRAGGICCAGEAEGEAGGEWIRDRAMRGLRMKKEWAPGPGVDVTCEDGPWVRGHDLRLETSKMWWD
jgi:hypothetical protein